MNIRELTRTAFIALGANKTRTFLTMLGIIIGIASVIIMLGIGTGAQESITNSVSSLGTNLLTITAGSSSTGIVRGAAGTASTLTMADAEAVGKLAHVAAVSPELTASAQIVAGENNTNTIVYGVEPAYATVHDYQVQSGFFISAPNVNNLTRVAVLGPDVATTLFNTTNVVGDTIEINQIQFKVIGVTVSKGTSGLSNEDNIVFIPLTTAQQIVFGNTSLRTVSVQVDNANNVNLTQAEITALLLARHNISDPTLADFTVRNSATTLSTLTSITQVFTILLASIASISLLVGGIGIMNIMIVTVTERTREIGLRKAIGAKNNSILLQFLIESIVLTFMSGVIGVSLGFIAAQIVTDAAGTTIDITIFSIVLACSVSFLVGVVFGLYPAYKASRLSPIEALRYE